MALRTHVDLRTQLQRFSGPAFSEGIETIRCEGMDLRVYSVAKTVVDLFRLRNKIGLDFALEASRRQTSLPVSHTAS